MGGGSFNEEETFSTLTTMSETLREILADIVCEHRDKLTLYGRCTDKAAVLSCPPAAGLPGRSHIPQYLYSGHPLRKEETNAGQ